MPVNTREKRNSAFALLVPSLIPGVAPSSIDAPERQASVWVYSGVLAGAPGGAAPRVSKGRSAYKHRFRDALRVYLPEG